MTFVLFCIFTATFSNPNRGNNKHPGRKSADRQKGLSDLCEPRENHIRHYGKWASQRNSTHHVPIIQPSDTPLRLFSDNEIADFEPVIAGNADECPKTLEENRGGGRSNDLMRRSLCPFYWTLNHDPHRMPALLPEARCKCPYAVTGNSQESYECHELKIDVRVLKFDSDCDQFREDHAVITVACVATLPTIHVADPSEEISHEFLFPEISE